MESNIAILQELERFGKGSFFKIAMEQFLILFGKILKYLKMDIY